jgi:hypothetical protein
LQAFYVGGGGGDGGRLFTFGQETNAVHEKTTTWVIGTCRERHQVALTGETESVHLELEDVVSVIESLAPEYWIRWCELRY